MKRLPVWSAIAMFTALTASCSGKSADGTAPPGSQAAAAAPAQTPEPNAAESPTAEPAKPAPIAPPPGLPAGFPKDCIAYAELIEKLKACDKIGAARDGLVQAFTTLRDAWPMVPPERRNETATSCRAQAESLRSAAAATCGW